MVDRLHPDGLPRVDLAKVLVTVDILKAYVNTLFDDNPSTEEILERLDIACRAECLK